MRPVVFGLDSLCFCFSPPPGLQKLTPDGGRVAPSPIFTPTESESLMSNRASVTALILIALFGVFSFVFLGNRAFMIGAVVAILLVAIARIVRIWAFKP